ncbi:MAG: type II toxin-antitoxin system HicA family toxin [Eubacteriales bacterium]|nr:type II toxin-antitoxin system HicA family toxin [Eubacteriales bacterium]
MRMYKVMNYREFTHILKYNGFTAVRISGSHVIFKRQADTLVLPRNNKPNRMLVERLIKNYNLLV